MYLFSPQARNSSSTYSSSLKDLLQRKINALEKQLQRHYNSHHDYGTHEFHPGHGHGDNHHDDHHRDHHDDLDNNPNYGHHYSHYNGHYHDQLRTNHNDNDNHSNHNDDHHDDHHFDPHDSDHHSNDNHGHQRRSPLKPTASRARGAYDKLDSVLNHVYHRSPDTGVLQ